LKHVLGNPIVQFVIGRTIGLYMLLVGWTTRWRKVNRAAMAPYWGDGAAQLVCCIWHGRFVQVHKLWTFGRGAPPAKFLISRSREGGIVAHASRTVGADVIRGSAAKRTQQKGGVEATFEIMRHVESGGVIGMTPDGPRGPRMRAKMGSVQIAKLAQAPLLPLAWSTQWRIVFNSWDNFILPLPFGRGALIWGDPIPPPAPDASPAEMELVRAQLEAELNRITAEADRLAGAPVIEPAPEKRVSATPEPAATAS
jgi:lysophospholipid acyltransferase (LPLAT)-like uncharacterized protein